MTVDGAVETAEDGRHRWFSRPGLLLLLSHFSRVRLLVTLWTIACQAPLPMSSFSLLSELFSKSVATCLVCFLFIIFGYIGSLLLYTGFL